MSQFDSIELRVGHDVLWLAKSSAVPDHLRPMRMRAGSLATFSILTRPESLPALRRFCVRNIEHLHVSTLPDAQLARAVQRELNSGRLSAILFTRTAASEAQARKAPPSKSAASRAPAAGVGQGQPGRAAQPAAQSNSVADWPMEHRLREVVNRAIKKTPGEAGRTLKELLSPESIALMIGLVALAAGANLTPAGPIVDLGILAFAYYAGGMVAVAAIGDLVACVKLTDGAKSMAELDEAADALSRAAVAAATVGLLILLHKYATREGGGGKAPAEEPRKAAPRSTERPRARAVEEEPAPKKPPPKEEPAKTAATPAQLETAKKLGVDPKWVEPNGDVKWPPNEGFAGPPKKVVLEPGTKIDRYGSPKGKYLSPADTPFEQRALPPSSANKPPTKYEVLKPIETSAGDAAPWFDQAGGGTQYKMNQSVEELIDTGYLREVK
jgi:hypothetical protein